MGQSESVMFLLDAGADVSFTKPNANTYLHTAVEGKCCKETLHKIIEQGINVNSWNKNGETALFLACRPAQTESVKLLLENGADPNISDAKYHTGFHAAVYGSCTNETMQEIITHGVYLDARNIDGEIALWLACLCRQQDSVKILLEAGSNSNIAPTDKDTCLHVALIRNCSKNMISAILDHGADVNARNKQNITALIIACAKRNKDTINVLLNEGADPNIADANGNTCLHYTTQNERCKEVLQARISHGVALDATNKGNVTALMIACKNENKEAINVLLNAGTEPNIADADGGTCLHYAAQNHWHTEVIHAIISHGVGVDINTANNENLTALMIALKVGI